MQTIIPDPHPFRFRSQKEFYDYSAGRIPISDLVQPGTPEYDKAEYEVMVVAQTPHEPI